MKLIDYFLPLVLVAGTFFQAKAQADPLPNVMQHFDASFGMFVVNKKPIVVSALSFVRTHGVLKSRKLRLGYGLRFSNFASSGLTYITAPYKLTKDALYDTLVVAKSMSFALNANLHAEYIIIPKLKVGFNIDVVGVGFGGKTNATFISSDNNGSFPTAVEAKPTTLNALLIGDNDWGQLLSEFYIGFSPAERFWIRGGFGFTFNEYSTTEKLVNDNARFRYKAPVPFLSLSYNPF
jgi:hypothetical protein